MKVIQRASALATIAFLLSATAVFADTIPADGDTMLPGNQANVDLGVREPGETVTRTIDFSLVCGGSSTHQAENAVITIAPQLFGQPLDGQISSTSTTIGPVPASWPDTGSPCGSPLPVLAANSSVTVTIKVPTTIDVDYQFSIIYSRQGATGLTGTTAITFTVDVATNTAPSLSLPGQITAEATSGAGATVAYVVGASDAEDDPDPTPSCLPASGSTFPLGPSTVTCTVTDSMGLGATGSFTVAVNDSVAPTLQLPPDMTVEATGPAGANVAYSATATDLVDAAPAVACTPSSGSTFPLGTTTVDCTATDAFHNPSSGSFSVTVVDTAAPGLLLPDSMAVEATDANGAVVTYDVGFSEAVDPAPVLVCTPPSGSTFSVGTTIVSCTATDASGNQSSGSFDVTVGNATGPVLTGVPADIDVATSQPDGATVTYASPSAADAVDGGVAVNCGPASGSTFPVGTTTVTCSAADSAGNATSVSFTVTVTLDQQTTLYTVEWGEPVSGGTLSANQSRTVPLKLRLFVDGVERTTGSAVLSIAPCGSGPVALVVPLTFNGGRWAGHLDTSTLTPGCWVATLTVDGAAAGSFMLDLRGPDPLATPKAKNDNST